MAFSVFDDKQTKPETGSLVEALGRATSFWEGLKQHIEWRHGPLAEDWVFSGKSYGWSLRLKQKKRAVMYLTPCHGYFRVAFAFGEKAVQAAHKNKLPAAVLKLIDGATKYPEGRAVRMEVRTARDVNIAEKLAAIKLAN
jgi:hypothetical protein